MKEKRDAPSLTTLDSIAELLPIQQREAFFRRMAFMRKLPENDEVLMIIDAMALLTKLTIDAPAQVASERTKLADNLAAALSKLAELDASASHRTQMIATQASRLAEELTRTLAPDVIATRIFEMIRQKYEQYGAAVIAGQIGKNSQALRDTSEFLAQLLRELKDPQTGAVISIQQAQHELLNGAREMVLAGRAHIDQLLRQYEQLEYGLNVGGFIVSLVAGGIIGFLFGRYVGN